MAEERGDLDLREELNRRLQPGYPHEHCQNSYLPWASVHVVNISEDSTFGVTTETISRCAYQFGAADASLVGYWASADSSLQLLKKNILNGVAPCWVLSLDDCVVSYEDVRCCFGCCGTLRWTVVLLLTLCRTRRKSSA